MYVKYSEDNERNKRKSPFSTTTLSFDALSPGNSFEYLHKPYTVRNYVPRAIFLSLTVYCIMGSSTHFRTVLSGNRRRQFPSVANPKHILTQNCHWRSFNVIYFGIDGIIEEPLRGYIAQYTLGLHTLDIHLVSKGPRRRLRSSTDRSCAVPRTHNTFGDWSFAVAGPRVWNSLPANLRDEDIPTRASGVNLKRTGFLALGAQCDILLNCAIQIALLN